MFNSTAASGAKSSVSSSWNEDASHTIVTSCSTEPTSELAAVPTLPATATGKPASRWMCPISSTVVVLPFVPVTATNSFGSIRHASSSSPSTGRPRSRAAAITGACAGTPGLLTTARTRSEQRHALLAHMHAPPRHRSSTSAPAGEPASTPITSSPAARSASAAAMPERARPTTS